MDNVKAMCRETLAYLAGLSVFSRIKKTHLIKALIKLLKTIEKNPADPMALTREWANFARVYSRKKAGKTFFMVLTELIVNDENKFTLSAERGDFKKDSLVGFMAFSDLQRLSLIADLDLTMIALYVSDEVWKAGLEGPAKIIERAIKAIGGLKERNYSLPQESLPYGLLNVQNIDEFASYIRERGAGAFAHNYFFHWNKEHSSFSHAENPDTISLDALLGYESQRRVIIDNTRSFIEGGGANNLLLYGDRGTGKSAAVKAIANEFKEKRLRLVELCKNDIYELPKVLAALSKRGLYFILFIDDLSFEAHNDDLTALKAMLEGGIEAQPKNVVIYATSNRRHFVKEFVSGGPPEQGQAVEARAFDSVQERLSLSDRFGVTIVFSSPSQEEFLKIAEFIAENRGLLDKEEPKEVFLREKFRSDALKWERWFNGRSPRTARQFVEWTSSGAPYPWE